MATASRALSNPELVAENTRDAVRGAVESCGYKMNFAARSLRTQRSYTLLALLPELDSLFYPEILCGIEEGARNGGYSIILGLNGRMASGEAGYYEMLDSRRADGLLIVDGGLRNLTPQGLRPPVPFVQLLEFQHCSANPAVSIDDHAAAVAATRHLIEFGHRRIAHVAGRAGMTSALLRKNGFRHAMMEARLDVDPRLIVEGQYDFDSGSAAVERLMILEDKPTAVFCANDATAIGVLHRCASLGIEVPRQLSVIGIDDVDSAAATTPPLTTIRQPRHMIGVSAASLLIDLIDGHDIPTANVVLPFDLVVRGSTAPAPHS